MKLLVCGAAGFIGSTFVELRVRDHGDEVTVLDALTYAGREENLRTVADQTRFLRGQIEDPETVARALQESGAEAVVSARAEARGGRRTETPPKH